MGEGVFSLGRRTTTSAAWRALGTFIGMVLQIGVLAVLARQLDPSHFGQVALANVALMFGSMLSQQSVRPLVVQAPSRSKDFLRAAHGLAILVAAVIAGLIGLLAPLISHALDDDGLRYVLPALAFTVLAGGFSAVAEGVLIREHRFKEVAAAGIISYALAYAPIALLLAISGSGVWSIVAGTLAQSIVSMALLVRYARSPVFPAFHGPELLRLVPPLGGITLTALMNWFAGQADRYVVGVQLGTSAVGLYHVAFTAMDMPRRYVGAIAEGALFPALAEIRDDRAHAVRVFVMAIDLSAFLMAPLSVALIALCPEIINVMLGEKWMEMVLPAQILFATILPRSIVRLFDVLLAAKGIFYSNALQKAAYGAMIFGFCFVGSRWGLAGVAAGVFLAVSVNMLLMANLGLRGITMTWKTLIKCIQSGLSFSAVVLICVVPTVTAARAAALPDYLIIAAALSTAFAACCLLIVLVPASLGPGVRWIAAHYSGYAALPASFRDALRWIAHKARADSDMR